MWARALCRVTAPSKLTGDILSIFYTRLTFHGASVKRVKGQTILPVPDLCRPLVEAFSKINVPAVYLLCEVFVYLHCAYVCLNPICSSVDMCAT